MRIQGYNVPVKQYSLSILFYKYKQRERYTVGFSGHMEGVPFELAKMLKKYSNKRGNIFGSFFGGRGLEGGTR